MDLLQLLKVIKGYLNPVELSPAFQYANVWIKHKNVWPLIIKYQITNKEHILSILIK